MPQTQITWTPAELFAAANQITRQRVIAQILDGHLNGVVSDSDWYVLDFEDKEEEGHAAPDPDDSGQEPAFGMRAATVH
jgi:hypothetical protein